MAFSYKDYVESQKVQDLYKQLSQQEAAKPSDWTGGTYGQAMQDALSAIQNRKKFSYDLNGDALYQQYKDRYVQQGKQAMQDTMGQAAALTGGYGSTYSQSAGQQQYNAYLQSLNDVVPELYQLALNRYQMEGDDLQTQYALLADQYNTEYGQYRDAVSDWQSYRDYLANRYDAERDTDYTMYGDAKNFAYQDYRNEIADQQWQQQYEESIRQFNEQMALSREQFAWQQAQAAAAGQSNGSSSGSSGSSSSGSSSGGSSGIEIVKYENQMTGNGKTTFSNVKKTLSGYLQTGQVSNAEKLVGSVWTQLSESQKNDIRKMGFSVS